MAETSRIEELRRRVGLDPASIAFAALAEEYRRAGQLREAIETCRAGLQRHPSYLSARVTLGRALLESGDPGGAQAEFERVVRAAPENLAAIRGLAEIHRRGDASDAPSALLPPANGSRAAATLASPESAVTGPAAHAAAPAERPSGIQAADSSLHVHADFDDPALAGLEEFLAAIQRARREQISGAAALR
jgi:tetratricopeptide (TPR) repeat protein